MLSNDLKEYKEQLLRTIKAIELLELTMKSNPYELFTQRKKPRQRAQAKARNFTYTLLAYIQKNPGITTKLITDNFVKSNLYPDYERHQLISKICSIVREKEVRGWIKRKDGKISLTASGEKEVQAILSRASRGLTSAPEQLR